MFHACVQRFDGMDEIFLGGELNRALFETLVIFSACHSSIILMQISPCCVGGRAGHSFAASGLPPTVRKDFGRIF